MPMCTSPSALGQALAPPPPGSGVGGVPDGRQGAPFKRPSRPRGPPTQRTSNQPNPIPYSMLTLLKKNMQKMREVQWEKNKTNKSMILFSLFGITVVWNGFHTWSIQECLGWIFHNLLKLDFSQLLISTKSHMYPIYSQLFYAWTFNNIGSA